MKNLLLSRALAIGACALLACSAHAATLFSSPDGTTGLVARFGLTGTPGIAPDSSPALEIGGEPTASFSDLLSTPIITIPASELGLDFVVSYDLYLPSGSNLDSGSAFIRFYGDADNSGGISFGPGSEFSARIENFGDAVDFGIVDQFQTVQITGTVPAVDNDGVTVDLAQINLGLGQNNGAMGEVTAFVRNVSVTTIPEPTAFGLLTLAGLGAVTRRRQ